MAEFQTVCLCGDSILPPGQSLSDKDLESPGKVDWHSRVCQCNSDGQKPYLQWIPKVTFHTKIFSLLMDPFLQLSFISPDLSCDSRTTMFEPLLMNKYQFLPLFFKSEWMYRLCTVLLYTSTTVSHA